MFHFPSGVQLRLLPMTRLAIPGCLCTLIVASFRSAPPSAGITNRSALISLVNRWNAIRRPSGDHAG
jgi:hypothetical protein